MLPRDYGDMLEVGWLEYGGGSRPGAAMIRFRLEKGRVWLDLAYVFDFSEEELDVQEYSFPVAESAFEKAWLRLVEDGESHLRHAEGEFSIELHLQRTARGFRFKLEGSQPMQPFTGASNIAFSTFTDVIFPPAGHSAPT